MGTSTLYYWLDGPGSNSGGNEIFRPSRPALWPTQPPVKMGTGSFLGVKCGRVVLLTTHPLLVSHRACNEITLPYIYPMQDVGTPLQRREYLI